jgi:hypothetical protein
MSFRIAAISSAQDVNARSSFDQDVSKDRAVLALAGSARTGGACRLIRHVVRPLRRGGGQLRAGEAANRVAIGGRSPTPTTPDLPVRGLGAGRSSNCFSAPGVAHEFEVPASGDMAHA